VADWKATGDPVSKSTVSLLALNGAFCPSSTPLASTASAQLSREVAYCARAYDDSELVGFAQNARKNVLLDQMMFGTNSHFVQWLTGQAIAPVGFDGAQECVGLNYYQPFMAGISMNVAMQIWQRSNDPRIVTNVQKLADFTWAQSWDPVKRAFWYENCSAPGTFNWIRAKTGSPDLNLMLAPAWAWLWKRTGNDKYRIQGDQIWEGGVQGAYLEQGKQFNQNYSESFNYLKWREQ